LENINQHNQRRALHENTPDVALDMQMACEAQAWADELADQNKFEHASASARRNKGENIAYIGSSSGYAASYTPELQWYDYEIPAWDFATSSR